MAFPETTNKVVVFYGVKRSGKTFILYDLFRKYKGNALYVDFKDYRLSEFETRDFERLKQAFFELKPHLAQDGKMDLIYIDSPFATGADFSVKIEVGDVEWTKVLTKNIFGRGHYLN